MKKQLKDLASGTKFTCPWDDRTGILISCDESGGSATVKLDPVRDENGKLKVKGGRDEWSVGTTVKVKRGTYSLKRRK